MDKISGEKETISIWGVTKLSKTSAQTVVLQAKTSDQLLRVLFLYKCKPRYVVYLSHMP
jgi:hypothetical protein